MSVGTGIRHSETNASTTEPVHLLQMWVPPNTTGIPPGYEQQDVSDRIKDDELFPLASGREADAAIRIHQRDATLWVARTQRRAARDAAGGPVRARVRGRRRRRAPGHGRCATGDAARLIDAGAST